MAQLTAKEITNLYLYGIDSTPTNLVDNGSIRPEGDGGWKICDRIWR